MRYLLVFIIVLSSCVSKERINEKRIAGSWKLYDVQQIENSDGDDNSFSKLAMIKRDVKVGALFSFFEDGTYTVVKGSGVFESGKWSLENDNTVIKLTSDKGHTVVFPVSIEKNLKGRGLLSFSDKKNNVILKFISDADPLKDFKNDPFYVANNDWRFKPAQPEDTAQLVDRFANYIQHIGLILKAAHDRKQEVVSFEFSQGPVKIYNGGIGVYDYTIVPSTWKNSLFSEQDAKTAYDYYEKYLEGSRYRGAAVGNWIEDDYHILLSIYAGLKELDAEKRLK